MQLGEVSGVVQSGQQAFEAWSLLPPLLAIMLAVLTRRVACSMAVGVIAGALIVAGWDPWQAMQLLIRDYLVGDAKSVTEHGMILLFTTLLGTMVGVITRNGAMQAVVTGLVRTGRDRRHGQQLTCGLGLAVFFDDYANTLVVGTSMRPITDRLRISREKLAFLVDATAAPVAGLAVISTWVGYEVGLIRDVFQQLGQEVDAYAVFLRTIPYRFYSLLLLVFVWTVARSGRDFGPMAAAESRAVATGEVFRPGSHAPRAMDETSSDSPRQGLARNAVVPLLALIVVLVVGLWWWGGDWTFHVMLAASLAASMTSVGMTLATRAITWRETVSGWWRGGASMFQALGILVLAWGLGAVCDREALGTADYLVELTGDGLPSEWMPALSFVLAAAIALATGSSFSTMALLIPISVKVAAELLEAPAADDPVLLGTLGAVLAGAIFGDHCSPISDTTVLSSAAAGCDHLDHVSTQAPYAVVVALVSLLLGYVPVGWGIPIWVCLPLAVLTTILAVLIFGRRPVVVASESPPAKGTATGAATGTDQLEAQSETQ